MRPLLLAAALLSCITLAQGVTQLEPTTADLARLMGDITSLEIAIPEGAITLRISYTMGKTGGHSEDRSLIWLDGEPTRGAALRLLILAPSRAYTHACGGEPIDVHLTYPGGTHSSVSFCAPLPEGAGVEATRTKHEVTPAGTVAELEAWTPVYLRAWTPASNTEPGAHYRFDPGQALTIQLFFSTADLEHLSDEPPLDRSHLLRIPEIRERTVP